MCSRNPLKSERKGRTATGCSLGLCLVALLCTTALLSAVGCNAPASETGGSSDSGSNTELVAGSAEQSAVAATRSVEGSGGPAGCQSDDDCYDGDPCTLDDCGSGGVCSNPAIPDCQLCGDAIDADIYLMLDRTGSTTTTSRQNEKNASRTLLNFFDDVMDPPPVAVGAFGCNGGTGWPGGEACTVKGLSNTEVPPPYGDDDGSSSDGDHYAAIQRIAATTSSVGTHFVAALNAAGAEFTAHGTKTNRVLIFLSDGGNMDGLVATTAAADALKSDGVEIFAILFESGQPDDEQSLRAIASDPVDPTAMHPGHFFNAPDSGDLSDIVQTIVEFIGCDDGDACTTDECIDEICVHTPVPDCCNTNGDCDDGNACTSDTCDIHTCVNTPIPDCCNSDDECDD